MASIESSSLLATIASLKKELLRLEEQVVAAGGAVSFSAEPKTKKAKKERDPDAPPPKENPYFAFLNGRLRPLLKEARADLPGTVPVAFAKHLLDSLAVGAPKTDVYDMESAAIIEEFEAWAADPEHLKAPPRKPKADGEASDTGSVASEPKERKKPAPMSEEQKAAKAAKAKATREANKAAKAADAVPAEPAAEPAAPAAEAPKAEPKAEPKKTFAKKAVAKPSYTLEQLQDFEEKEINGETYGVNPRGDTVDNEGGYVGNWDGKALNKAAPKPADWEKIMG
jgi:hypothetical protein